MSDFVLWEPGLTVTCVLCGHERGGADPPGPWQRAYRDHRRRVPILGPFRGSYLGYFIYERE